MTSAAKPDPWLAQKVRFRAQGKENEPMRKKVPAGLVIVLAIMFLMTAVAAAVTNGFGLLRYYPEQAENTAFTDRIVSIGQTWEGETFSAEIKEAVFDGYKLRFTMSITPKEGAEQVFVYPVVKAVCGDKKLNTDYIYFNGWTSIDGFWLPDMKQLSYGEDFDPNDMICEVALLDYYYRPRTVSEDVEWTITFNALCTDWKVTFGDSENYDWEDFKKLEYEAYERHELLLEENGGGTETVATHPYVKDGALNVEGDYDDFLMDIYTREIFTLKEQAVFSFVADKAEIRRAKVPVKFVLPEKLKYEITKAEATADGINVFIQNKTYHTDDEWVDTDELPWDFVLKSDEAKLDAPGKNYEQEWDDNSRTRVLTYKLEYSATKPLSSVKVVPVQNTTSGRVEREDLAIELKLE